MDVKRRRRKNELGGTWLPHATRCQFSLPLEIIFPCRDTKLIKSKKDIKKIVCKQTSTKKESQTDKTSWQIRCQTPNTSKLSIEDKKKESDSQTGFIPPFCANHVDGNVGKVLFEEICLQ